MVSSMPEIFQDVFVSQPPGFNDTELVMEVMPLGLQGLDGLLTVLLDTVNPELTLFL